MSKDIQRVKTPVSDKDWSYILRNPAAINQIAKSLKFIFLANRLNNAIGITF